MSATILLMVISVLVGTLIGYAAGILSEKEKKK